MQFPTRCAFLVGFIPLLAQSASFDHANTVFTLSNEQVIKADASWLASEVVSATNSAGVNTECYDNFLKGRELILKTSDLIRRATFGSGLTDAERAQRIEDVVEAVQKCLLGDYASVPKILYVFFCLLEADDFVSVLPHLSFQFSAKYGDEMLSAAVAANKNHLFPSDVNDCSLFERIHSHFEHIVQLTCCFPTEQRISNLLVVAPPQIFSLRQVIEGVATCSDNISLLDTLLSQYLDGGIDTDLVETLMPQCFYLGRLGMVSYLYERLVLNSHKGRFPLSQFATLAQQNGNHDAVTGFVRNYEPALVDALPVEIRQLYDIVHDDMLDELVLYYYSLIFAPPVQNVEALCDLSTVLINNQPSPKVAALFQILLAVERGHVRSLKSALGVYKTVLAEMDWENIALVRAIINGHKSLVTFLLTPNSSKSGYLLSRLNPATYRNVIVEFIASHGTDDMKNHLLQAQLQGFPGFEGMVDSTLKDRE